MKGLFKEKPKSPVEVVRQSRNLLGSLHSNAPDFRGIKREEKTVELSKLIRELKLTLYGSNEAEPVAEACKKLTEGFFRARKDATQVVGNMQRQCVESR